MLNEFIETIKQAKNIAIITHLNPDGDALGSSMMMYEILDTNFSNVHKEIFTDFTTLPKAYMSILKGVLVNSDNRDFDTVITVDCPNIERLSIFADIFNNAKRTINFDHHKDNNMFAQINFVNTVSSNCENLYTIFKNSNFKFTKRYYKSCFVGMMTDTVNFTVPTVSSATYSILSEIKNQDIDTYKIQSLFFGGNSLEQYKILALAMNKIELWHNNKVVFCHLNQEDFDKCNMKETEMHGIINQVFNLDGALMCFLANPHADQIHISMRCKDGLDVSHIANYLGGGGHTCASACYTEKSIDEVKEILFKFSKEEVDKYVPFDENLF